jgi:hypothetical protein
LGVPPEIAEHGDHSRRFADLSKEEKLSWDQRRWKGVEAEEKWAVVAGEGTRKGSESTTRRRSARSGSATSAPRPAARPARQSACAAAAVKALIWVASERMVGQPGAAVWVPLGLDPFRSSHSVITTPERARV